jgi:hypothetical protein
MYLVCYVLQLHLNPKVQNVLGVQNATDRGRHQMPPGIAAETLLATYLRRVQSV